MIRTGDPQTAVGHLGDVVLFVQYTLARFKVCLATLDWPHLLEFSYVQMNDICSSKIGKSQETVVPFLQHLF